MKLLSKKKSLRLGPYFNTASQWLATDHAHHDGTTVTAWSPISANRGRGWGADVPGPIPDTGNLKPGTGTGERPVPGQIGDGQRQRPGVLLPPPRSHVR
jgi:hypothetical protein